MAFSFKEITESDISTVLVVDALNLAFRWKHSGAKEFVEAYEHMVRSLAQSYKCGTVIIAADWGSSSYRKEIYPAYKGNREEKYKNQTPQEEEAFIAFIQEYNRCIEHLEGKFPVLRYKGVEADDIAALICKNKEELCYDTIWLVSSDKDWDLLIEDGVNRFSYVTRKETTVDTWNDHYPVTREQYISLKCLQGDSGDNVPGIEGIGPVRAKQLIDQYGSAMDIYDNCPLPGTAKYIQNLNKNSEQILLNYELMDLETYCEEAIGKENVEDILNILQEKV